MKKILSCFLVLTFAFAMIGGCGVKPAAELGTSQTSEAAKPEYAKVTWYFNESGIICPPDAYQCRKALEELNIEYVPINPTSSEYESILLSMLASGEQIDVMATWKDFQIQLLRDGLIQPVDKYLNANYLPNLIRISRVWDPVLESLKLPDGKIYAVPSTRNNALPEQLDWIRKDWLDKLGLKVPTTFEELTDVLLEFAKESPNEDNVNYYANMFNEIWGVTWIFEAHGATDRWYNGDGDDGMFEFGLLSPRIKDALNFVRNLIENKASNEDFMTTTYDTIGDKIRAGVVGYHHGWSGYDALDEMQKIYPDSEWIPLMPLKSQYYSKGYASYERRTTFTRDEYSISSKCRDVDAVMRLMDWMCVDTATVTNEPYKLTFEGSYWYCHGERGVNWEGIDGVFIGGGTAAKPEWQDLADKFQAQNDVDKWAGWAMRRFQNQFDTRWMGGNPRDQELNVWKATVPQGDAIPANEKYLVRSCLEPIDSEEYNIFVTTFGDFDTRAKFAEMLGYPAILGVGETDKLFDEWLAFANANGYQNIRKIATDHYEKYPFKY